MIYVGEDLDVLLELCDRIVVLCGGKVNGILDARKTTKEEVGLRMTNLVKRRANDESKLQLSRLCASPSGRVPRCPKRCWCAPLLFCWRLLWMRFYLFCYRPEPHVRVWRHVERHVYEHHPFLLDAARPVHAALRRHRAGPGLQDALLELRRRGSDPDRRPDCRPHHGVSGQQSAAAAAVCRHGARQHLAAGASGASFRRGSSPAGTPTRRCSP